MGSSSSKPRHRQPQPDPALAPVFDAVLSGSLVRLAHALTALPPLKRQTALHAKDSVRAGGGRDAFQSPFSRLTRVSSAVSCV